MLNCVHALYLLVTFCESQWIQPASVLPRSDSTMAVGAYNGSIYFLGGYQYPKQIIEYQIHEDIFTDYGNNELSVNIWGSGSHYTQIGHILYIIQPDANQISTYNMRSKIFETNYMNRPLPNEVWEYACLTSSAYHLFVLGGETKANGKGNEITTVQALDLVQYEWLIGVPSMKVQRADHACVVDPSTNTLYSIGGWDGNDCIDSIEQIDSSDITHGSWQYTGYLTDALLWLQAILYDDIHTIFVIGGAISGPSAVDTVHIINTITGEVSLSNDVLVYDVYSVSPVIVDHVLYAFGGGTNNKYFNKWMKYELPIVTEEPTFVATTQPTESITTTARINTQEPTAVPTTEPTDITVVATTQPTEPNTSENTTPLHLSTVTTLESTIPFQNSDDESRLSTDSDVTLFVTSAVSDTQSQSQSQSTTYSHLSTDTDSTVSYSTEPMVSNTNAFDGAEVKGNGNISTVTFGDKLFVILVIVCGVLLSFLCLVGIGIAIWCLRHKKKEKRRYTDTATKMGSPAEPIECKTNNDDRNDDGENTVNIQQVTIVVSSDNENNKDYDGGDSDSTDSSGMYDDNQRIDGETAGNIE